MMADSLLTVFVTLLIKATIVIAIFGVFATMVVVAIVAMFRHPGVTTLVGGVLLLAALGVVGSFVPYQFARFDEPAQVVSWDNGVQTISTHQAHSGRISIFGLILMVGLAGALYSAFFKR